MLTRSQTLRRSQFPKNLLQAGFVFLLAISTSGCLLTRIPTHPVEISRQAQPRQTLKVSLTPTCTPDLTQTPTPTQTAEEPESSSISETPPISLTSTPTMGVVRDVIGISVEGRPLEVYGFGSGPEQLMIVAGIHGGYEWNTIALADELIAYLQAHPEVIPPTRTLFILRNLNPDGEAADHGPDGRANAHGVDLNRNFPLNWQQDWRRSGCWQLRALTAGTSPASEPETQALMTFIEAHPNLRALISYHSAGLGIFPGGFPPDLKSVRLAESLAAVSSYKYPPVDTGCFYTGQLISWVAAQGIAAVDIELTNHHDTDFEINLKVLEAFLMFEP